MREKQHYRILIVEDDSTVMTLLSAILTMKGHECVTASDGIEALEKIEKDGFDAVITDIVLSGMDGITLTKELSRRLDIPIMVITGFTDEYYAHEAIGSGATDLATKPFTTTEFLLRFERMMHNYGVSRLAIKDPLTDAFNRRRLFDELHKEIERSTRYERPLCIIMFDIDYFKHINDTYGHPVGDNVLKEIVSVAKEDIRKIDLMARYGGEEFVILLPETKIESAIEVAEKLREKIQNHKFEHIEGVTCSFGVTEYAGGEDVDSFIKRMDDALYTAKRNGRNRVESLLSV